MKRSMEVGVQYCVPPTGRTLDPLAKVPAEVLDKVQRHTDRVFHAASKEPVVSFNVVVNMPVNAPDSVAQRPEKRVLSAGCRQHPRRH